MLYGLSLRGFGLILKAFATKSLRTKNFFIIAANLDALRGIQKSSSSTSAFRVTLAVPIATNKHEQNCFSWKYNATRNQTFLINISTHEKMVRIHYGINTSTWKKGMVLCMNIYNPLLTRMLCVYISEEVLKRIQNLKQKFLVYFHYMYVAIISPLRKTWLSNSQPPRMLCAWFGFNRL